MPFLSGPVPRILAHRGLALSVPENTLPAFEAALAAGADILETDVHATADGACVIRHDPTVVVGGRAVRVDALPLGAVREVDLGGDVRVPLLTEALDAFPGARFNIDVKDSSAADPAVRAIRDLGADDRVLVTSFAETTRSRAASALPGVASSASRAMIVRALPHLLSSGVGGLRRVLSGVAAVQIPESYGPVRLVTRRTVGLFHRAGVEVHVWTVNDPDAMRRLVAMGVDGIVTDRTDLAVATLRT